MIKTSPGTNTSNRLIFTKGAATGQLLKVSVEVEKQVIGVTNDSKIVNGVQHKQCGNVGPHPEHYEIRKITS